MSTLMLPFRARGRDGRIVIKVRANDDPYATGHDLVAKNFDHEAFQGFPVLTAEVEYPGEGPAGWFSWIQLIRHVRDGATIDEEIDGQPLYVQGYHPTFADAPANPDHLDLDWRADAFLVDIVGRELSPIVGFSWGYRRFHDDRTELLPLEPVDAEAWPRLKRRLEQDYDGWTAVS
ncbi:hypothetical protein [Microlunatus sp. GCM10028923]|uniref:hypothetical protein n=1 Tax=Microlunatus sp. GCM10028923 TaxID=3273400 RepID=UPI003621CA17